MIVKNLIEKLYEYRGIEVIGTGLTVMGAITEGVRVLRKIGVTPDSATMSKSKMKTLVNEFIEHPGEEIERCCIRPFGIEVKCDVDRFCSDGFVRVYNSKIPAHFGQRVMITF